MAGRSRKIRWVELGRAARPPRADGRRLGRPIVFIRADRGDPDAIDRERLEELHEAERHLYRAARRTARAAGRGLSRYEEARADAAEAGDDGVIVEMLPNIARGMAVTSRDLALVPLDLVRATYRAGGRRLIRRGLRTGLRAADRRDR